LELHWGSARAGTLREHNSVVVTAEGQPFDQGIVLDGWRHLGWLHWTRVTADRYPWKEVVLPPPVPALPPPAVLEEALNGSFARQMTGFPYSRSLIALAHCHHLLLSQLVRLCDNSTRAARMGGMPDDAELKPKTKTLQQRLVL
jgi:hypothetical protein